MIVHCTLRRNTIKTYPITLSLTLKSSFFHIQARLEANRKRRMNAILDEAVNQPSMSEDQNALAPTNMEATAFVQSQSLAATLQVMSLLM